MSYEDILTENIKKEYTAFRKNQLSQNTETVFENAGKIHFYKNLYCYAVNSNLKTAISKIPADFTFEIGRDLISFYYCCKFFKPVFFYI